MAILLAIGVFVLLMVAAARCYDVLNRAVSKAEKAASPYVPVAKEKVASAAQYVRPRAMGWCRRLALGVVAHLVVFFGAAAVVAIVRPAPTKLTYDTLALKSDASWLERNSAYVGVGSGLWVRQVRPGFLYSTAELSDGTVLVGLPGSQRWYGL